MAGTPRYTPAQILFVLNLVQQRRKGLEIREAYHKRFGKELSFNGLRYIKHTKLTDPGFNAPKWNLRAAITKPKQVRVARRRSRTGKQHRRGHPQARPLDDEDLEEVEITVYELDSEYEDQSEEVQRHIGEMVGGSGGCGGVGVVQASASGKARRVSATPRKAARQSRQASLTSASTIGTAVSEVADIQATTPKRRRGKASSNDTPSRRTTVHQVQQAVRNNTGHTVVPKPNHTVTSYGPRQPLVPTSQHIGQLMQQQQLARVSAQEAQSFGPYQNRQFTNQSQYSHGTFSAGLMPVPAQFCQGAVVRGPADETYWLDIPVSQPLVTEYHAQVYTNTSQTTQHGFQKTVLHVLTYEEAMEALQVDEKIHSEVEAELFASMAMTAETQSVPDGPSMPNWW